MNAVEAMAIIKAAFVLAVGHTNVYWEDEPRNWAPHDSSLVLLNVTTMRAEGAPREEEDETTTTFSLSYVLTVRALAEDLQNTGQALRTLTQMRNRFQFTPYRDAWRESGIAIVDLPMNPVRLNRPVDGRQLAVMACDVLMRVVLTDTIEAVSYAIETVSGTGTLNPGNNQTTFTATKV